MERLTHFFLKTNSGRLVLLILLALAAAYAARVVLIDMPAHEAKAAAAEGAETLEAMDERIEDMTADALPELTSWYPEPVPCGATADLSAKRDALWSQLGLAEQGPTAFQYRLRRSGEKVEVHARRDSDCDGFYAIWTLSTKVGSALGGEITAQNILE